MNTIPAFSAAFNGEAVMFTIFGGDVTFDTFAIFLANVIAWIVVAPVLDIVIYSEPANLVFTQGAVAALWNAISMGVIGSLLLFLYSKTRSGKGSLEKE